MFYWAWLEHPHVDKVITTIYYYACKNLSIFSWVSCNNFLTVFMWLLCRGGTCITPWRWLRAASNTRSSSLRPIFFSPSPLQVQAFLFLSISKQKNWTQSWSTSPHGGTLSLQPVRKKSQTAGIQHFLESSEEAFFSWYFFFLALFGSEFCFSQ